VRLTPVVTVLVLTLLAPTVIYPQRFVPATSSLVLTTFPPTARIMGASTVLNDAIAIYLGESIVEAVYVGAEQVWP
jgi:hypothetical protein